MAVKCNIVGLALDKLYELQYGIVCKDTSTAIVENYIEYLNCETLDFVPCSKKDTDCKDLVTLFRCFLKVSNITIVSKVGNTIVYGINMTGGTAPYTYEWEFNESDFVNSGAVNTNQSTLTVVVGKDLNLLVSRIWVQVTDAEGCVSSKECILTPDGLICISNYQSCPNISSFEVVNKVTYCAAPNNLIITNTPL